MKSKKVEHRDKHARVDISTIGSTRKLIISGIENQRWINKIVLRFMSENTPGIDTKLIGINTDAHSRHHEFRVLGLGGLGCSIVNNLMSAEPDEIKSIACDADAICLEHMRAHSHVLLSSRSPKVSGAQGLPNFGRLAALENKDNIIPVVQGTDVLFLIAGMGGSTATNAAPVMAKLARKAGTLVIAIVTKPFSFEGPERNHIAEQGIKELIAATDTTIVIPNDRLLSRVEHAAGSSNAFNAVEPLLTDLVKQATIVLYHTLKHPLICFVIEDLEEVLGNAGRACIGMGRAEGSTCTFDAARAAIKDTLIDMPLSKATRIQIILYVGRDSIGGDMRRAMDEIAGAVNPEADIMTGTALNTDAADYSECTLIAGGFQ